MTSLCFYYVPTKEDSKRKENRKEKKEDKQQKRKGKCHVSHMS